MNKARRLVFASLLLLASRAPAQTPSPTPPAPLSTRSLPVTLARTELFFGRIAPADWADFLSKVVTPRFPDGLTWFDSHGQWQNPTGIVTQQDSRVLILLHAPSAEKSRLIDEVRDEFKSRYHEQSVLRADETVTASF